jgi:Protein of unknown function (DUF2384)
MRAIKRIRDPDETADITGLILRVVPDGERWMDTPNAHFEGLKPKDLIGTDKEKHLRNLVRAVKTGMFS